VAVAAGVGMAAALVELLLAVAEMAVQAHQLQAHLV
jgi:hypothetical protein